ETVASVDPIGEAKVVGPGEGAVVIRYQGLVATARVISPYGPPRKKKSVGAASPIDQLVLDKLAALGLEPSGRCTDEEFVRRVYLGVRVQCARCHNHPFEKWTQRQYYQMAAFFARVKSKKGDASEEQDIYLASTGEVQHPKTGKDLVPTALDAAPVPADYHGD